MGFNSLHCKKAAINTSNAGVEEAMTWLLSHIDDPGQSLGKSDSMNLVMCIFLYLWSLGNLCFMTRSCNTKRCCEILSLFFCADINDPISHESLDADFPSVDESSVDTLISFGFQEHVARKALKISVRFLFGKAASKDLLKYCICLLCEKCSFVCLAISFVFHPSHLIELTSTVSELRFLC